MQIILEDVESGVGPFDQIVVATGSDSYGAPDAVMLEGADRAFLQPAQARELAAALLRGADEAEGRTVSDVAEEERAVRAKVADELERMDGTNLGMSLTRSHAVKVARQGLRPEDTQHGTGWQ